MIGSLTKQLQRCESCPRLCRVNRIDGELGFCRIGAGILVSHAGLHFGEEPPISGTNGSGTIFFAGCNLRCVFCQNYQISQEFQHSQPRELSVDALVAVMLQLQSEGAHNINFVSPSHMIFPMADAIAAARKKGLAIPVVYNSNGYDSVDALGQIRGLVDIFLPDIKYMDDDAAARFSGADSYSQVIPFVLEEMLAQVGHLMLDEDGIATQGLLVRHLILPGQLENSRRCLETLAAISPDIQLSIMSQYSPQYNAHNYPDINRTLTPEEYDSIVDYAIDLGLENAFIQEFESQDHYLPDFTRENPFRESTAEANSSAPDSCSNRHGQ
ncbi:MAG: radical SAM protein [Candidatus Zhuqueibacterota bacterium]